MTVRNASHYKHLNNYYGSSLDPKPTHSDLGDIFQELDGDKLKYIFTDTGWELYEEYGTDAIGISPPSGAVGIRGWLSGIYNVLKNTGISIISLPALNTGSNIIGKIGIDQTILGTTNAIVNKDISGNEIFTITNPAYTQQVGNILQEQLTETDAIANVLTFSTNISTIELYNTDAVNTGIFNVNGIDITVPPEKYFKSTIGGTPNTEVTISGATTYIVSRYE